MNINQVYYKALDKLNKLISNAEQAVPKHIFVQNFNEAQLHWVSNCYKLDEHSKSEIHKIEQLVVPFHEIKAGVEFGFYKEFDIPANYYSYSSIITNINKCPYKLETDIVEFHNIGTYLKDPDINPSLQFEETIATIGNDKIQVYYDDTFKISTIHLNYYRYPTIVNMADGFTDFNGAYNQDIDPEFTEDNLEEIIDIAVSQIASNLSDVNRKQLVDSHIQTTQVRV